MSYLLLPAITDICILVCHLVLLCRADCNECSALSFLRVGRTAWTTFRDSQPLSWQHQCAVHPVNQREYKIRLLACVQLSVRATSALKTFSA